MNVATDLTKLRAIPGGEKFREISFRQISVIYDNILKTGMKPFVELSFMPSLLASGDKQALFGYRANITPPRDFREWGEFIVSFVRHLINRYGENEVKTWYFEVWNEPNLSAFWSADKAAYFRFYEVTAKAVKSVCPDIAVGGPSTAASAWTAEFAEHCEANGAPLDFISTHQYAGEPLGHQIPDEALQRYLAAKIELIKASSGGDPLDGTRLLLGDGHHPELPRDIFAENAKHVKETAHGLPVFYTEWNVSSTCTAWQNDTRMAAAYAVKNALDLEGIIEGSAFWCFSDIFEELFFFSNPFSGGFGLLTIDGIPKPSYHAFRFLAQTGSERLALPKAPGDWTFAAYRSPGEHQILLCRQSHEKPDSILEPAEVEMALPQPPSRVTAQRIDESHANPLKLWQDLGSPKDLTAGQVEDLKGRSFPCEEDAPFSWDGEKIRVSAALGKNDVNLFKVYD
jgi:xylan 1,4-beta-xylosidase